MNDITLPFALPFTRAVLALFRSAGDAGDALRRDEKGATFVEYIILVGIVALLGLVAFRTFSSAIVGRVQAQATQVQGIQ